NFHNALAGVASLSTGVVISRALKATIPRGWQNGTRRKAEDVHTVVGNVAGALIGLANWLAPSQVDCPE
ncbi:hypothetical protein, partial [Escherichia coli]